MTQSAFVDALTEDITNTGPASTFVSNAGSSSKQDSGAGGKKDMADDIQAQMEAKYNIPALVEEKEAEIKGVVEQLDALKEEINRYQIGSDSLQSQKQAFEEEKKELADSLKKV